MKNMNSARWKRSRSDACFIYKLDEHGLNIWSTHVTPNNDHPKQEAEAAARLMFAAPDMLEALRLVRELHADCLNSRLLSVNAKYPTLLGYVDAAITKATQGA